jgi:hypothetical protein
MKVTLKKVAQAGNNTVAEMYFNEIRVSEIHCTPREYEEFIVALSAPNSTISLDTQNATTNP